jgi:hypothetical protein
MKTTPAGPPVIGISWSPSEAAAVNQFLDSPVGRKWLSVLLLRKPKLDLSSTERSALTGAFGAGYESIFGVIAETRIARTPVEDASAPSINPDKD